MKNILLILLFVPIFSFSQLIEIEPVYKTLPEHIIKDINGKSINTTDLTHCGPIVISFWATWCSPCKKELAALDEIYEDLKKEYGIKIVTISIDDEKTKNLVKPYVNGKGWEFEFLLDPNGDFKRLMGVNNVPHTFLIDKERNIVYSHNNYTPGDEDKLVEQIKNLKK